MTQNHPYLESLEPDGYNGPIKDIMSAYFALALTLDTAIPEGDFKDASLLKLIESQDHALRQLIPVLNQQLQGGEVAAATEANQEVVNEAVVETTGEVNETYFDPETGEINEEEQVAPQPAEPVQQPATQGELPLDVVQEAAAQPQVQVPEEQPQAQPVATASPAPIEEGAVTGATYIDGDGVEQPLPNQQQVFGAAPPPPPPPGV